MLAGRASVRNGHRMSAWPINASVLVQPAAESTRQNQAVVYASAGRIGPVGGAFLCALAARTGRPLWETPLDSVFAADPGRKLRRS